MPRKPTQKQLENKAAATALALENKVSREVLRGYKKALNDLRAVMSKTYEKYSIDGVLTHAEMTKYNRLIVLEKQIADILGPTFTKSGAAIRRLQRLQFEESFFRHGWVMDQGVGVELKWGLFNPEAIKAAAENEFSKIAIQGARQNGLLGIRREVTSGLIQGDSYPKMARKIKKFMDRTASSYETIVRTEGQKAIVKGQIAAYDRADELGVESDRIWDATLDSVTRDTHGALDGVAGIREEDAQPYWMLGGVRTIGPGQSGVAAEDISCRCRLRNQITGYKPEVRRIRDEGVVPYKTFGQWARPQGWTPEKGWPKKPRSK